MAIIARPVISALDFLSSLLFGRAKHIPTVDVDTGDDQYVLVDANILGLLERSTRLYPPGVPATLEDRTVVPVPDTWRRDIGRSGEPDRFKILDEDDIKDAPREQGAQDAIVKRVHMITGRDLLKTQSLLQCWSYRAKADLVSQLMEEFLGKYKMNPVPGRDLYEDVSLRILDAETVECRIKGRINSATKETDEGFDLIQGLNISYNAKCTFKMGDQQSVKYEINFQ